MAIDKNKQWTKEECEALVMDVANRTGCKDIGFRTERISTCGEFRTKHAAVGVTLPEWLWTGEHSVRGKVFDVPSFEPEDRLLATLHQCAHMVTYLNFKNTYTDKNSPAYGHGLVFQTTERRLARQFGWAPVYNTTPGYADHYLNLSTGENWKLMTGKL